MALVTAFWKERSWSQANLARELGVSVRVVRRMLEELSLEGWLFEREEDHPHVYWTLPNNWFPGGMLVEGSQLPELISLLLRTPRTRARTRLLDLATKHAPAPLAALLSRVVPPQISHEEEEHLSSILDAAGRAKPIGIHYFSASRGALSRRVVSIQRVVIGPPARFVARCHNTDALRWFRVSNVVGCAEDEVDDFRSVDAVALDSFLEESVDGYHGPQRVRTRFYVRDPEARWVATNLPSGLDFRREGNGIEVEAHTAGLLPVARFVVGLGGAARVETPELASLVERLAREAIAGLEGSDLNTEPACPNQVTGLDEELPYIDDASEDGS